MRPGIPVRLRRKILSFLKKKKKHRVRECVLRSTERATVPNKTQKLSILLLHLDPGAAGRFWVENIKYRKHPELFMLTPEKSFLTCWNEALQERPQPWP